MTVGRYLDGELELDMNGIYLPSESIVFLRRRKSTQSKFCGFHRDKIQMERTPSTGIGLQRGM